MNEWPHLAIFSRLLTLMVHAGSSTFRRKTLKSMIEQARWTENDLKRLKLVRLISLPAGSPVRAFVRACKISMTRLRHTRLSGATSWRLSIRAKFVVDALFE